MHKHDVEKKYTASLIRPAKSGIQEFRAWSKNLLLASFGQSRKPELI